MLGSSEPCTLHRCTDEGVCCVFYLWSYFGFFVQYNLPTKSSYDIWKENLYSLAREKEKLSLVRKFVPEVNHEKPKVRQPNEALI